MSYEPTSQGRDHVVYNQSWAAVLQVTLGSREGHLTGQEVVHIKIVTLDPRDPNLRPLTL